MELVPGLLFLVVFFLTVVADANGTELHIGLQTRDVYIRDTNVMKVWTRRILSYINQMELIQNYTLVPDFLKELAPVSLHHIGHISYFVLKFVTFDVLGDAILSFLK